jgi:metal-responsive CopG/Arc/MetJ family transcriptional regulator
MSQKKTTKIEVPEELIERVEECAEERGFNSRKHFVIKAIRDAVDAEDPFTQEAPEKIRKAREDDDWVSLEEIKGEIGMDDE